MRCRFCFSYMRWKETHMLINKLIWVLLFCFGIMMTSCIESTAIDDDTLIVVDSIHNFPDSSFFSDLRHMKYEDGYLYMLDVKRRNVICLDTTLAGMKEYGTGGRGHGELQAPFAFTVKDDTVSVLDFMSRSLKLYSSSGYIREIDLEIMPNDGRMDISNENEFMIPLSSDSWQLSIVSKENSTYMGCPEKLRSLKKTKVVNHNHIFAYNDCIAVIPTALPYVQLYDGSGRLLKRVDLDKARFYKKNLSYIISQGDVSNDDISYVLNVDSYLYGDELYVLCSRYGRTYKSDRILVVDLNAGIVKKVLMLPESNYGSICFDGYRFYVFNDSKCSIDILEEKK